MSSAPLRRESPSLRRLVPWAALCLAAMLGATARAAVVVADPGNPAAPTSTTASMTAGGVTVPVKTETLHYTPGTRSYDIAKLTVSAATTAVITASGTITSYSVSPTLAAVTASASGSELTVSLPGPVNLVIHINSQPDLQVDVIESQYAGGCRLLRADSALRRVRLRGFPTRLFPFISGKPSWRLP